MDTVQLTQTANILVARAKGLLAADESTGTMRKRLVAIGVEPNEDNRRAWRELLFTTPGLGRYISGAILFDETIRQRASTGKTMVEHLRAEGIVAGIKVDKGLVPLAGSEDESVTDGLDGLRARFDEYARLGARFSKWRAAIRIDELRLPSPYCLRVNAHALARFAALSQAAGLVPIVEPEVLMDGRHPIQRCFEVTEAIHKALYEELYEQGVFLEGSLLKPNMVLSGKDASPRASAGEVAEETLRCLRRGVPAAVPGVVFLSGGQGDDEATENLDAINRLALVRGAPWQLSFSYGRGLQATPLRIWAGREENTGAAQAAVLERARATSVAREGEYATESRKERLAPTASTDRGLESGRAP
jgi:fructose-bisphosphate aldolase class I